MNSPVSMRPPKQKPRDSAEQPAPPATKSQDKRWSFSFRYLQQVDNFGVAQEEKSWFVSLIGALSQLNALKIDEVQNTDQLTDFWRYHPINWTLRNVPISKEDLSWVPRNYIENSEEFPMSQFQISKTKGRVVGFFDEQWVFQIVLLDPLHNIQPSKDFNYRVRRTNTLTDDFTSMCEAVERAKTRANCGPDCPAIKELRGVADPAHQMSLLYFKVSEASVIAAQDLFARQLVDNHGDIYEYGISHLTQED